MQYECRKCGAKSSDIMPCTIVDHRDRWLGVCRPCFNKFTAPQTPEGQMMEIQRRIDGQAHTSRDILARLEKAEAQLARFREASA